jgi:hypothetical protein
MEGLPSIEEGLQLPQSSCSRTETTVGRSATFKDEVCQASHNFSQSGFRITECVAISSGGA